MSDQPAHHKIKVGAFEITIFADGKFPLESIHPALGANKEADEVNNLLVENKLSPTEQALTFTPMLVNTGTEIILFDTGNGDDGFAPRPDAGNLLSHITAADFKPEDISKVVITHAHPDHIGGIKENGVEVFQNAEYIISATEFDFWSDASNFPEEAAAMVECFQKNTSGLKEKFRFINPGEDIATGITTIAAPGHTPGHIVCHLESNAKQLLLMADCAHHPLISLARPDWYMGFDTDKDQGVATRKKIFDMAATDKIPVMGYHMPFPGLGMIEKKDMNGYRWCASNNPID